MTESDLEPAHNLNFDTFFQTATGHIPYPFQRNMATSETTPDLIEIPTGLGKTDAVILGWLWKRRFEPRSEIRSLTPRRLVYCLPMRVLVEQTRSKVKNWLDNLGLLAQTPGDTSPVDGFAREYGVGRERIAVTVLMGGEEREWWDLYPEQDAIIIGTQDMLLSRALNRGYGMSRYRWPMHFGLLNNDCLWVMDEIQLMGRGLATTTQLQAFRSHFGTIKPFFARSIWMSATLEPKWLRTVDFDPNTNLKNILKLSNEDLGESTIQTRTGAFKQLRRSDSDVHNPQKIADIIIEKHQANTRTLVVVNTVKRAVDLYTKIFKKKPEATLVLIHSRFRPKEREKVVQSLLDSPGSNGTIIISTQVIEAGVDVSAKVLFTEVAPWPSLVQRFGRCNRSGEYDDAEIYWIDIPSEKKGWALPYTDEELMEARNILTDFDGQSVGPACLPPVSQSYTHEQVIRKKDLVELFDTTPDLAGSDIDISRFIRDSDNLDLHVFWRNIPKNIDTGDLYEPLPHRDELCSVPVGDIKNLIEKNAAAWIWDSLDGRWISVQKNSRIFPGMTLMLRAEDGRYTITEGWNPSSKKAVPLISNIQDSAEKGYSGNEMAVGSWLSVAEHTDQVCNEMGFILESLGFGDQFKEALLEGARWHDAGKAHQSFQALIKEEELEKYPHKPAAKAPKDAWKGRSQTGDGGDDERRTFFRHELASGILALQNDRDDLVAYLAAAHHGKVRGSIRSMPNERIPPDKTIRFARGVWEGDVISDTDLGGGVIVPRTVLSLSYMDLGMGPNGPSWTERVLNLRDTPDIGPFRLAYLEALMKASDERASRGGV